MTPTHPRVLTQHGAQHPSARRGDADLRHVLLPLSPGKAARPAHATDRTRRACSNDVVAAAAADHDGIAAHFAASPTEPGSGPFKTSTASTRAKTAIRIA